MMKISPPSTLAELSQRAFALAGSTLGDIAKQNAVEVPRSLHYAKGWIGQLMEKALGANAANLDQPDFVKLGIELKTLPIKANGQPCESTYICTAPIPPLDKDWESSRVWRKMASMLFLPIETHQGKALSEVRVGTPLFWSPTPAIYQQLKQDWEELTELLTLGEFENLSAHKGEYLQIRPKAANAKTFIQIINNQGQLLSTVPKGFYLRTKLTRLIVEQHYALF